jgi:hypothetical protein
MHAIKTPVYAHYFGETREIVNGHVVKDTSVNTTYDGKNLHIDIKDNHLKTLLSRPTSKINLLERLNRVYRDKTHKKKTHREKTHRKKTHKKSAIYKRHL